MDESAIEAPVGGFTPLSEASSDLIGQLRDAIPPIYDPEYGPRDAL